MFSWRDLPRWDVQFERAGVAHLDPLGSGCQFCKGEQRHDEYKHTIIDHALAKLTNARDIPSRRLPLRQLIYQFIYHSIDRLPRQKFENQVCCFGFIDRQIEAGNICQLPSVESAIDTFRIAAAELFHRHFQINFKITRKVLPISSKNLPEQRNGCDHHCHSLLSDDAA